MRKKSLFKVILLGLVPILAGCSQNPQPSSLILVDQQNYPILVDGQPTPVLQIVVENQEEEAVVNDIQVDLAGANPESITTAHLYYTGDNSTYNDNVLFGTSIKDAQKILLFHGHQVLKKGKNYFWLTYELSKKNDLHERVNAYLNFVTINGQKWNSQEEQNQKGLRTGIALRKHNQDGVHTYRIPGLATTKQGSLLAIYDVRRESSRDLQGHMDIGVSRSIDGGISWEPMRIVLDMGKWGGLPEKFNGVSDACILVDNKSGAIFIVGLWMHGVISPEGKWIEGLTQESNAWNHQWRNRGSQPGLGVKQTSQFIIAKSTDDGKTWSEPVNLTSMCKDPKWWLWAPAPGHGITLKDGTLVFPTQGRDENGLPFSNITYSKDGGTTWKTSKAAYHNTTECMAVELGDGSIMLNMRDNRNRANKGENNGRAIAVTKDLGETWIEHPASHGALIEPVCMGSIHRHDYNDEQGNKQHILLFSNPNSKHSRHKQTIKVSLDEGKTWPEKYWIELDEGNGRGYSCLTSIDEKTIGILYEGSQVDMIFQRIRLSELLQKNE